MRVAVWTTAALPGFHRWPEAPDRRAYLRDRHRHLFHVTAKVLVDGGNNRPVEFHDLQDRIRAWWGPTPREWGALSCELIAAQLFALLREHDYSVVSVAVSEDNESGAMIET